MNYLLVIKKIMKIFRKIILISLGCGLTSCGTLKEGFTNQKKNSNDEFLVEKKSPLVTPPNYNDLPMPSADGNETESNDSIKKMLSNQEADNDNLKNVNNNNKGLGKSILEKIKNN